MTALEHYTTQVATARADAPVRDVADFLAEYAVGCAVVVDEESRPIGVVTDRDLLCRVIAAGRDPGLTTAADVMTKPVITASPQEPLEVIVARMRATGVRRLPVVREDRVTGIVTLDDLVFRLGSELDDLGEAARREVRGAREHAARARRRREWRHDLEARLRDLMEQIETTGKEAREQLTRELETLRERLKGLLERKPPRSEG